MTEYLTEQEQIEVLKKWLKQYSLVILAGVALAVIAVMGWRYWQERQAKILNHASVLYDGMLNQSALNHPDEAAAKAKKLINKYPKTVYSQFAAFMLAKDAAMNKDYATANKQLTWVIDHSNISAFRQIARIRLAQVMLANHQPEAALKTLEKVEDKSFNGLIYEMKGDAYLALKNLPSARQAYQQALTDLPNAEGIRPLLQMKYDNL
ncbi:MAG TPA: tetratricopeptide repeat protein [Gammaproteobacteria bacterium]|nr:tetratricopeptide repeat protein [Gammaproteobacteria bacterium]